MERPLTPTEQITEDYDHQWTPDPAFEAWTRERALLWTPDPAAATWTPPASPTPSSSTSTTASSPLDDLRLPFSLTPRDTDYSDRTVPTISEFIRTSFYFRIPEARTFINNFNKIFKVTPPLKLDWLTLHSGLKEHAAPRRGDPYCTCSCCHYNCPTHTL